MVFFVDWAGWYVIISFSSFFSYFFLSSLPLLLLCYSSFFLSFDGGFVETNTTKNKRLIFFFWTKLQLTDYGTIWNRIEFNGAHHKLFGIFIYSVGRMVGGWKGDFER